MTGPHPIPGAASLPLDTEVDESVDGAGELPDDVPNDALTPTEPEVPPPGSVADTDVDAEVVGTPLTDDEIGA